MSPTPQSQLELIYRQLGRSTGFRGFTPDFVLTVGGAAAITTVILALISRFLTLSTTVVSWVAAGALIGVAVFATILLPALRAGSGIRREAAQATGTLMAFPLGVGLAVTLVLLLRHPEALRYLPAAWLVLFGLGISALAGVMRERVEYVALFYLAASVGAYMVGPQTSFGFTLTVGVPFAAGHGLTGLVLAKQRSSEESVRTGGRRER